MQLVITNNQKKILFEHANKNKPNEACALLFGITENDNLIVKEIFLTKNIDESKIHFTVSNDELIRGYKEAEEKKLEVVGIFHSHPDSEPYPSSTDVKFMKINPVSWLIFSGISSDFKAYGFDSEIFDIPIVT